jgi:methylated-DNA-[protein]-cysteine S-methyltransferase
MRSRGYFRARPADDCPNSPAALACFADVRKTKAMASLHSYSLVCSPLGELLLTSDGKALTGLYPATHRDVPKIGSGWLRDDAFFTGVRDQLEAYFSGRLTAFEVPLSPKGSEFQQTVWQALRVIPFGSTWTYGELATHLGHPKAARAVGLAVGRTPLSLIVPCHRVVGAKGQLTGYAGGLAAKKFLLTHESTVMLGGRSMAGPAQEQTESRGATMRVHARVAHA